MANRVVITICGEEYTLVADETSAYMQKVGSCVSDKMTEDMLEKELWIEKPSASGSSP